MKTFPHLLVCEHCDSVYQFQALPPKGGVARCRRCAAVLYRHQWLDLNKWLALVIAAAIVFAIANLCPVVKVSMQGLHNEATLWQASSALAQGSIAPMAVATALFLIFVPFLQISLLLWILLFAHWGQRAPGFVHSMKLLAWLHPWSMVEVCMLGLLVASVKLASYLEIIPGAGLFGMAVLMVLITVVAGRRIHALWYMVPCAQGTLGAQEPQP